MTNAPRVTKANGHIVQADWNQTDPLKMDYIHNKPELPEHIASEEFVSEAISSIKGGTQVTVGGEVVETFNADNKLDKQTSSGGINNVYMATPKGGVTLRQITATHSAYQNNNVVTLLNSNSYGNNEPGPGVLLARNPTKPYQVANKKYVDSKVSTVAQTTVDSNRILTTQRDYEAREGDISWDDMKYNGSFGSGWQLPEGNYCYYELCYPIPLDFDEPTRVTFSLGEGYSTPGTTWARSYSFDSSNIELDESGYGPYPYHHGADMFEGEGGHEFICIIADTEGNSTSDPDYYLWDITDGSYDCDDHETVTLTGTHFDLYVVECNIGFLEQDASSFEERYEIPLHYKAISAKETPDDPNFNEFEGGAVHETVLASNREVHYSYPVTELIITDFVESYDSKYAQQWVLSFIAGDTDPLVIVPSNVKYIGGAPWFQANKRYLLTFKKICGDIYCIWSVI